MFIFYKEKAGTVPGKCKNKLSFCKNKTGWACPGKRMKGFGGKKILKKSPKINIKQNKTEAVLVGPPFPSNVSEIERPLFSDWLGK